MATTRSISPSWLRMLDLLLTGLRCLEREFFTFSLGWLCRIGSFDSILSYTQLDFESWGKSSPFAVSDPRPKTHPRGSTVALTTAFGKLHLRPRASQSSLLHENSIWTQNANYGVIRIAGACQNDDAFVQVVIALRQPPSPWEALSYPDVWILTSVCSL